MNSLNIYGSKIARTLGRNATVAMKIGSVNSATLWALKNAFGELYHQLSGHEQQDSHECLILLEDLGKRNDFECY